MKTKYKKVRCKPKLSSDGYYRVIIDTYYHDGSNFTLRDEAQRATGAYWEAFGCFMDTCCKSDTDEFDIYIKWFE